jgi:hypothetical protein
VDISTGGTHSLEEGKVFGDLETKYKWPQYGLTLTEKWNTDNLLVTEISCQDKMAPGGKLSLEGVFSPDSGLVSLFYFIIHSLINHLQKKDRKAKDAIQVPKCDAGR